MLATIADIKDLKNEKNKIVKFFKWTVYSFRLKRKLLSKLHGSITKGELIDMGLVHAYLGSIDCNGNTDMFRFECIPADVRFDLVAIVNLKLNVITDNLRFNAVITTVASDSSRKFTLSVSRENTSNIMSWSKAYDDEIGLVQTSDAEANMILPLCADGMKVYTLMAISRLKGYIYEQG